MTNDFWEKFKKRTIKYSKNKQYKNGSTFKAKE